MLPLFILAFGLVASSVRAQAPTISQIQNCGGSVVITAPGFDPDLAWETTYSTTNTSSYTVTWMFDATKCLNPQVPITKVALTNDDAGIIYPCSLPTFTASGTITSVCSKTYGDIAQAAEAGEPDWIIAITMGARNVFLVQQNQPFYVTAVTPPEPSGAFKKRTRSLNNKFKCEHGQSWCRTNTKTFECHNTSSEVTACGACPYDDAAVDCTSIEGVDAVQCKHSRCYVDSCVRGYQVAPDRQSCLSHTRALVAQKYRR